MVNPFATLVSKVNHRCVRLLINREEVGRSRRMNSSRCRFGDWVGTKTNSGCFVEGFLFDYPKNRRDVKYLGDIEDGVKKLAELLGWEDELEALTNQGQTLPSSPAQIKDEPAGEDE